MFRSIRRRLLGISDKNPRRGVRRASRRLTIEDLEPRQLTSGCRRRSGVEPVWRRELSHRGASKRLGQAHADRVRVIASVAGLASRNSTSRIAGRKQRRGPGILPSRPWRAIRTSPFGNREEDRVH
jgi:hypothetical protein